MAVAQNTLYLTTPRTVVHRDHLTLRVEIEKQTRLTVPIHHLESICAFGQVVITPPAMALCWDHQVAVHYHTENGYLLAQVLGSGDTRYLLRRAQYAAADSPQEASRIARQFVAGKLQNARANLLRAGREAEEDTDRTALAGAADELAHLIHQLGNAAPVAPDCGLREALDPIRGLEGIGAKAYFSVFGCMIKQQREDFRFVTRSRRPPRELPPFIYICFGSSRLFGRVDDCRVGRLCRLASCNAGGKTGLRLGSNGRVSAMFGRAVGLDSNQPSADRGQALSRARGRGRRIYRAGQERGHSGLATAQANRSKTRPVQAECPLGASFQHSSQIIGPQAPRRHS